MDNLNNNISDIKRNSPYDKKLQGETSQTNDDFSKIFPWLSNGSTSEDSTLKAAISQNEMYPLSNPLLDEFGKSQYDNLEQIPELLRETKSINQMRSENQPWYDQVGNSLLKYGVITGTTFADNFLGTAIGLLNLVTLPVDYDENVDFFANAGNKFFNNPYSEHITKGLQDTVEEEFPIYKSDEYLKNQEQGDWQKNLGATWLVDNAPQLGFTSGTILSGYAQGAALGKILKVGSQQNLIKNYATTLAKTEKYAGLSPIEIEKQILRQNLKGLPDEIAKAANAVRTNGSLVNGTSLVTSTFGEARLEAINASEEFTNKQLANLNSEESLNSIYQQSVKELQDINITPNDPDYDRLLNELSTEKYNNAEEKIKSEAKAVSAMTGALNIPILTASNAIAFNKVFSRGFNTQRGFLNNLKEAAQVSLTGETSQAIKGANRIIKDAGKYAVKGDKLAKFKIAGDIGKYFLTEGVWEEMGQGAMSEAAQIKSASNLNSFLGFKLDPNEEQEQLSTLNSILKGVENTYTDWGKYEEGAIGGLFGGLGTVSVKTNSKGKLRPTWEGGVMQAFNDYKSEKEALNSTVDYLNNRLENPTFKNYYQGLIRHNSFQTSKDGALKNNDEFTFKNADHAQLISDIIMFEKAGRINDLNDIIDEAIDSTNLSDPIKIAKKANELKQAGNNNSTDINLFINKTDEQIVKESNEFSRQLKSKVEDYRKISNDLKSLYGDVFTGDSLEEMTFMFSQIKDWESRFDSLNDKVRTKLNELTSRGLHFKKFNVNINGENSRITLKELLEKSDAIDLIKIIKSNSELQNIININELKKKTPEADSIYADTVDLIKIANARTDFVNKYNDFLENPNKLNQKLEKQIIDFVNKISKKNTKKSVEDLKTSNNLKEFRDKLNDIEDEDEKKRIIDNMSIKDNSDYNPIAMDLKKSNNFENWYGEKSINLQNAENNNSPDIVDEAKRLLKNKINNSTSFQDLLNTDNIDLNFINDSFTQNNKNEIINIVKSIINEYKTDSNISLNFGAGFGSGDGGGGGVVPVINDVVISDLSSEELLDETNIINNNNNDRIDKIDKSINTNIRWNSGIHEIELNEYKETGILKSRTDSTYKDAADYLESKGAFEYVNRGNLKEGDKVFFVIDPDYINLNDWTKSNRPLLLATKDKNNNTQIIGTFNPILNKPLHNSILEEYDKLNEEQKEKLFESSISTTVTNITPGRIGILKDNERELSEIIGDKKTPDGNNIKIVFGISDGIGSINTNTTDMFDNITTNIDSENSGRLYYGVKNSKGTYIPVPIRVKRFGDIDISNTEFGKLFEKSLDNLAIASLSNNEDNFSNGIHNIRNFVYVGGNSTTKINLKSITNGNVIENYIEIKYKELDTKIDKVINIPLSEITSELIEGEVVDNKVIKTKEEVLNNIKEAFKLIRVPFQINKNDINGKWESVDNSKNYNDILLDANILTSNLQLPYVRGSYFYINRLDEEFKEIESYIKEEQIINNAIPIVEKEELDWSMITKADINETHDKKPNIVPSNLKQSLELYNSLSNVEKEKRTFSFRNLQLIYLPNDRVYNITGNNLVDEGTVHYNFTKDEYNKSLNKNVPVEEVNNETINKPRRKSKLSEDFFDTNNSLVDEEVENKKNIEQIKKEQEKECPEGLSDGDEILFSL